MQRSSSFPPLFRSLLLVTGLFFMIVQARFSSAQDKGKEEWKPTGKVWGLAFGDGYYKLGSDSACTFGDAEFAKVKKEYMAFTFRRIYLGYDYNIAPDFTAKIVLEGNDGLVTGGGDRTVIIKSMNLEWKGIVKRHSLFIGQSGTPCFNTVEKTWGYRSVEKTIGDARKIFPSNDMGLKWVGQLDSLGNFSYTLMYGNGKGTKPEDNRLKRFYLGLDALFMEKKLILSFNTDYEDYVVKPAEEPKSKLGIEAFTALQLKSFTVGAEFIYQIQKNFKINTDPNSSVKDSMNVIPMGISLFAKGTLQKDKWYVFGRFDRYNNDLNYRKGDNTKRPYGEQFFTFGLDYAPNKNIHLIPNIWINMYTDLREKPADYDVAADWAKYYDRSPDIVPRLTFYYLFK